MNIPVINSGSSSIKYRLVDMDSEQPPAVGLVERVGEEDSAVTHHRFPGSEREAPIEDHRIGMQQVIDLLTTGDHRRRRVGRH